MSRLFSELNNIWDGPKKTMIVDCGPGLSYDEIPIDMENADNDIISCTLNISSPVYSRNNQQFSATYTIKFERFPVVEPAHSAIWENRFTLSLMYHNRFETQSESKDWLESIKEKIRKTVHAIQKKSPVYLENPEITHTFSELVSGVRQIHDAQLNKYSEILQEIETRRINSESELRERRLYLETTFRQREKDIQKQLAELDRASHKSERRRLFDIVTNEDNTYYRKTSISRENLRQRYYVAIVGSVLGIFLSITSIFTVREISVASIAHDANPLALQYLIIKSVFAGIGAAASFIYVATWIKSYVNSDIEHAREVDKFNADMIRASWAIETILEVQQEYSTTVPDSLVTSMVNNLFAPKSVGPKNDEAALALKALLGFSGKASFGPEGARVEIDKKDARRLSDGAEDAKK
ncbi:hypothetical protein HW537_11265 [Asaia siamensis]